MTINYKPKGVCARNIELTIVEDIIIDIKFTGGCNGNLKGLSTLAIGRNAGEVATMLAGMDCGGKGTSCPDQLSLAIRSIL